MGYYTCYELSVMNGSSELITEFVGESEYASYAMSADGDSVECCKWYNHEDELRAFSLRYPDVVFVLRGEGEDSGDIWIKYIKNGKCQVCKAMIVFDEFDEAKLM